MEWYEASKGRNSCLKVLPGYWDEKQAELFFLCCLLCALMRARMNFLVFTQPKMYTPRMALGLTFWEYFALTFNYIFLFIYLQTCKCVAESGGSFLAASCSWFSLTTLSIPTPLNSTELFWSFFWDCSVVLNVIWRRVVNLMEVYIIVLNKVRS